MVAQSFFSNAVQGMTMNPLYIQIIRHCKLGTNLRRFSRQTRKKRRAHRTNQ